MYDSMSNTPAIARTSNVPEDLGQVEYIFTDKTGTLTENEMNLNCISVNGQLYGDLDYNQIANNTSKLPPEPQLPPQDDDDDDMLFNKMSMDSAFELNNKATNNEEEEEVLHVLKDEHLYQRSPSAIFKLNNENLRHQLTKSTSLESQFLSFLINCNTITVDHDLNYVGVSLDELSLVLAAKELGIILKLRTKNQIIIQTPWSLLTFNILYQINFTSNRAKSSIIVQNIVTKKITLYIKGADHVILANTDYKINALDNQHLELFSIKGLRTLVIGYKELTFNEFQSWFIQLEKIQQNILHLNKKQRIKQLELHYNQIECNYIIQGITAIEDKLQENVIDTIHALRDGNIKIFMLTGDKNETAIHVAYNCGLLDKNHQIINFIIDTSAYHLLSKIQQQQYLIQLLMDTKQQYHSSSSSSNDQYVLLLNGQFIINLLELDFNVIELFLDIIQSSQTITIICSRLSPLNKFQLVSLIKILYKNYFSYW